MGGGGLFYFRYVWNGFEYCVTFRTTHPHVSFGMSIFYDCSVQAVNAMTVFVIVIVFSLFWGMGWGGRGVPRECCWLFL